MNPRTCATVTAPRGESAARLERFPLGSSRAHGWLGEQLRLAADGLTGHLGEVWPDVGATSGWLGGDGESWERGPYYARGLVALAHALGSRDLAARVQPWIEWSLASQDATGFFGPVDNSDWWARMPMLEALRLHAEATDDARVEPFLRSYFRHQHAHLRDRPLADWARPRGADNAESVLWLHARSGEPWLLDLAALLLSQTSDWLAELAGDGPPSDVFELAHGVNRAMGFRAPPIAHLVSGDPRALAALRHGWVRTLEHHGQLHGLFSCDELLHGTSPVQGTELCAVVETLSSLHTAQRVAGEPWIADAVERIAYNALPAAISADHRSHQYFQQANQIACVPGPHGFGIHHETDLLFGTATGYGCCAANFHIGWPMLASHVWYRSRDGGVVAMQLAPSRIAATIGGAAVRILQDTDYPFGETVRFVIECPEAPVAFALSVRLPGWATSARAALAAGPAIEIDLRQTREAAETRSARESSASAAAFAVAPHGVAGDAPSGGRMLTVRRTWRDGDVLALELPMEPRVSRWERGAIAVEHGPLAYALPIAEDWRRVGGRDPFCDWELHPRSAWGFALCLDPSRPERDVRVIRRTAARQPWARAGAPTWLEVHGRRIPGWTTEAGSAGPVPTAPLATTGDAEPLLLVPYGCARLRMALLPAVP